jgi:ADP-ribose pyrophosphatase
VSDDGTGFRLLGVRHVADSSFLKAERLHLISPTGVPMERTMIRHPGAVAMVAIDGSDVVLIRQYRSPTDSILLEIPAGKLDLPGEDLVAAARRELEEEVGFTAASMELLTTFWTTPGFSNERLWIYLATDLTPVSSRPHGAEEEVAEIVRVPVADIAGMLAADEFDDAKTIIGLAALVARLG